MKKYVIKTNLCEIINCGMGHAYQVVTVIDNFVCYLSAF